LGDEVVEVVDITRRPEGDQHPRLGAEVVGHLREERGQVR
jgi:hypothetical protein